VIILLSRDGVIARYIFAFCFFFISGTQMITGWPATISGVLGTVELATAFLCYSPLYELVDYFKSKTETQRILLEDKTK
jgi:hypothetical protein